MARKKKFELNDNNLAIAYYRFSSHSQNEASIDQQRELAHAWADAHGFKIVKEYEDAAISGTTEDRPGFQQMLSEVAKIRPRVLIMWKTDRLGRDKYVLAPAAPWASIHWPPRRYWSCASSIPKYGSFWCCRA